MACKHETNPTLYLPAVQCLKGKERLGELPPQRRLISAEPVHDVVVEIG
jgi:hypothetical protein